MRIVQQITEQNLLQEYIAARFARDRAQARVDELQARLTKQMEADQQKTLEYNYQGIEGKVTYVTNTQTRVDEAGLRKALTAKVFDKYTVRKLDKRAMEKAMADGEIDPLTVAQHVKQEPSAPFLRVSFQEAKEA